MLEFLRGKASDRKLRLFACACCRHIWDSLPDEHCRKSVEVAEHHVDGLATDYELHEAWSLAYPLSCQSPEREIAAKAARRPFDWNFEWAGVARKVDPI